MQQEGGSRGERQGSGLSSSSLPGPNLSATLSHTPLQLLQQILTFTINPHSSVGFGDLSPKEPWDNLVN